MTIKTICDWAHFDLRREWPKALMKCVCCDGPLIAALRFEAVLVLAAPIGNCGEHEPHLSRRAPLMVRGLKSEVGSGDRGYQAGMSRSDGLQGIKSVSWDNEIKVVGKAVMNAAARNASFQPFSRPAHE